MLEAFRNRETYTQAMYDNGLKYLAFFLIMETADRLLD